MARRPNADSARTVDAIISAALALLNESRRVDDLSLRQVAQRANVGLSTVQYYFSTRDALLDACLDGYHQRLVALAKEVSESLAQTSGDRRIFLEHVVRRFFRFARSEKTLIQLRVSTTLTHREQRTLARDELGAMIIREAANVLAPHTGASVAETRFAIHSMSALIVRSALASDVEVKTLTDLPMPEAIDAIEDQLVRAGMQLLAMDAAPSGQTAARVP
ncbi:MAG: TetR/AcrR family transcriptional regulator [Polyangiales bacterium]